MIKTEEQRRWWFATHPELSWSHRGGGSRGGYGGGNKDSSGVSPKDVDSYVDEALKYATGTTAELLKALKSWFGTEFESKTPEEQHALLWGDEDAAQDSYRELDLEKDDGTADRILLAGGVKTPEDAGIWDMSRMGGAGGSSEPGFRSPVGGGGGIPPVRPTPPVSGGANTPPARSLPRNMIRDGSPRPENHAAHHIVSQKDGRFPEAEGARNILKKFDIDLHGSANGVWLPNKPDLSEGQYHPGLHTGTYYREVERLLGDATTREEALRILKGIGERLSNGRFPK